MSISSFISKTILKNQLSSAQAQLEYFSSSIPHYGNQNENYLLQIIPNAGTFSPIFGYMPSDITWDFEAKYSEELQRSLDSIMSGGGGSKIINALSSIKSAFDTINKLGATFGGKTNITSAYLKNFASFIGSNKLQMTIPITFVSWDDEWQALRYFKEISKAVLPTIKGTGSSTYLLAPGARPNLSAQTALSIISNGVASESNVSAKNLVLTDKCFMVKFGNYAKVSNVYISRVSGTAKSAFSENGAPMLVKTNITINSVFPMTAEDLDGIFYSVKSDIASQKVKELVSTKGVIENALKIFK